MSIFIVSTIYYAGRVLAIVDINNGEYRTAFYRSSGSNVDNGEGLWFPFMGIVGPGLLKRTSLGDNLFAGKISKDFIYTSKEGMYKYDYILRRRDAHSDPKMRWNAYNVDRLPFNLEEVAENLRSQYKIEDDKFLAKYEVGIIDTEIEFVNSWLFHGLNSIRNVLE
jgi:hypothetical protein